MKPIHACMTLLLGLGLSACVSVSTSPVVGPVAVPAAVTVPPAIEYPHIKRPNLVVSNLARSLTIYRDILGLDASDISTSSANSYSYPVFKIPEGTPIRGVTLHEPGEQRVLALTELASLDLPRPSDGPHMSAVVIGVTNLPGMFEQIAALGLTITEPRVAGGADFTFVEQAFVDFDGHLIVLYEVLPETAD